MKKREGCTFFILYDKLNPWQHSGNSLSESQWKLCNRNKIWHIVSKSLINSVKFWRDGAEFE